MKRVKLKFTYEIVMRLDDREYEETKKHADTGEGEKEIKKTIDDIFLGGRRNESSKIPNFYFGADKEWQ